MSLSFSKIVTRQWKALLAAGIFVGGLAFLGSLVMPLEYRADAQVLVIAHTQAGADPVAVAKVSQQVADSISGTIGTDAFFNQVLTEDMLGSHRTRFDALQGQKKRKAWERATDARAISGTNLLTVSAYDTTREGAEVWANAIADTIVRSGSDYVGTLVYARVVNQPIASTWPVRPNIVLNTGLGFLVGVLGMVWLSMRKNRGIM